MKKTILHYGLASCFAIIACSSIAFAQAETTEAPLTTTETVAHDTTITVKVSGVTCGGDLPVICKYVQAEKGILEIKTIGKPAAVSTFEVKYNPAVITFEQVVAKLEDSPSCDAPKTKPFKVKK